jgi:hypothetical protein
MGMGSLGVWLKLREPAKQAKSLEFKPQDYKKEIKKKKKREKQ